MIYIYISEINEILFALEKTSDAKFASDTMHDLMKTIQACSYEQFIKTLQDQLYTYDVINMICPYCGDELHMETWYEPRPFGNTVEPERMAEIKCSNCTFVE